MNDIDFVLARLGGLGGRRRLWESIAGRCAEIGVEKTIAYDRLGIWCSEWWCLGLKSWQAKRNEAGLSRMSGWASWTRTGNGPQRRASTAPPPQTSCTHEWRWPFRRKTRPCHGKMTVSVACSSGICCVQAWPAYDCALSKKWAPRSTSPQ